MITMAAKSLLDSDAMVTALAKPLYMSEWPEHTTYMDAPQPEAICRVLVSTLHRHLVNASIACLFRKDIQTHDKTTLAKASKAGSKLAFLTDVDLCIDVNHTAWVALSREQRVALIDHELCHFGVEDTDDEDGKFVLLSHDVEEFGAIVSRWGLWKPDLATFGRVVAAQTELFASESAAT